MVNIYNVQHIIVTTNKNRDYESGIAPAPLQSQEKFMVNTSYCTIFSNVISVTKRLMQVLFRKVCVFS